MKKFLIVVGSILALIIVALLLAPLFYPVDHLKPKIEEALNSKLRGKVEIGTLSLSAFPSLKLNVNQVLARAPSPYDKEALAQIDAVHFEMPLWSLLVAPRIIIGLEGAHIHMIQNGADSNLKAFLPAPENVAVTPQAPQKKEEAAVGETLNALPGIVASRVKSARLSLNVKDADLIVKDLKAPRSDKTEVHKLNLSLLNVGIAAPIEIHFMADIDYKSGAIVVAGPSQAHGTVSYTPDGKSNKVTFDLDADESQLDFGMKPLIHKPTGVPLSAKLKGDALQGPITNVHIADMDLQFAGLIAKAQVALDNATAENKKDAKVNASLTASKVALAPFGTLVPMVRDFKLGGTVTLKVAATGNLDEPQLSVAIALANVTGTTPNLKRPIKNLNGQIKVSGTAKNPSVVIDPFSLKVGSSDLSVKILSSGLEAISAKINVSSKRLNVDELLGLAPLQVGDAPAGAASGAAAPAPKAGALDESLDSLAPTIEEALKNPMLDKIKAAVVVDFNSVRAMGAEFSKGVLNLNYANRQLKVSKTGLGGYGGRVSLEAQMGLSARNLTYDFSAGLTDVKVQEMTAAHAPKWNGVITGAMSGDLKIAGRGLRKADIAQNLNGGLKGELKGGRLNMPIVTLVGGLIEKLPSIGGKKVEIPKGQSFKGDFKTLKIVTAIKGRNINLQSLDVLYNTSDLGIGDMRFTANGNVNFDRQVDITGTAFLNPQNVPLGMLKGPSGQIELPLKVAGDMSSPKPDYGYSLKILGPRLAQGALKSDAGKKLINGLQQNAPKPVQQGIDALRKKFGF